MKIGIYFETSKFSGGANHQNIRLIDLFKKYLSHKHDITYLVTNNDLKKKIKTYDEKCIFFKKNLISRVETFFLRFEFVKEIYKKLKLTSRFEKFLINQKFDLVFFNSPYEISLGILKVEFVMILLSMQHKTLSFLPEYKGSHDYETRDYIIKNAINKSFKVFVGTKKDKDELIHYYNAPEEKVIIQPYAINLPIVYEKNKKKFDYQKCFQNLNLPQNKNILIYPAQFWAHKNHKYIVDTAIELKKQNIKDIFFVFCGSDKGNLNYIKEMISKNLLGHYFKIFNYIDDNELIALYLNCYGVIMPTLVGHSTIPMYEAFYFKKNIFYSEGLADNSLINYILEIDLKDTKSFLKKYQETINNKNNLANLENTKNFYIKNFDEITIANNFDNVFKDFEMLNKTWSKKIS